MWSACGGKPGDNCAFAAGISLAAFLIFAAAMKKLLLASNNQGKVREFAQMLAPLGLEVLPQGELDVPEAEEPYSTFVENALAKARHASALTGLPALADDSGLCVPALHGAPGVHSARFAGPARDDVANNEKLLALMQGVEDRRAHFVCLLALVRHPEDPEPVIIEGKWKGSLLAAPVGKRGFGYDPLFLDPESGLSSAQLPPEVKNARSHRGRAVARFAQWLKAEGGL
jgi:XTP/dITP diphosphohydrolase